jgi:hypothetical protein
MTTEPDTLIDACLRLPDHVVHRSFVAETVLLNLQTGNYHGLNPVGGVMLEAVNDAPSVRHAAEVVAARYEQDPAVVQGDLLTLCEQLLERGLLEIAELPADE